jgi:hypothetical protein
MELYKKKNNIENKQKNRRIRERNNQKENNQRRNIYLQKMIEQNINENDVLDLKSAGENINNVRNNMEDIFSNDENKKKAIKYVIEIGKIKSIRNSPNHRLDKSASPSQKKGYIQNESNRFSPNSTYYDGRFYNTTNNNNYGPNTVSNFYNPNQRKLRVYNNPNRNYYDEEEYNESQPYYNNPEESQNDYEPSSSNYNDDKNIQVIKYSRSPEPKIGNKYIQIVKETYERSVRRPYFQIKKNKDIQIRQNRQINNNYNNINTDDEIEELIKTINELQSIINSQKNEIIITEEI